jgi:hypothetical protein
VKKKKHYTRNTLLGLALVLLLPFTIAWLVSRFDTRTHILIEREKITDVKKTASQDIYQTSFVAHNRDEQTAYRIGFKVEIGTSVRVASGKSRSVRTQFQPFAEEIQDVLLHPGDTKEILTAVIVDKKRYALGIGAVGPAGVYVEIEKIERL